MVMKVSSKTNPTGLAGAVTEDMKVSGSVSIQAIGPGAVGQAVKGIAIARGFLAPQGIEIYTVPFFKDIEINGEPRTAIVLEVRKL